MQRFTPQRSQRKFNSDLHPFAACHFPSLSPFKSKLSYTNKGLKCPKNNLKKKMELLMLPCPHVTSAKLKKKKTHVEVLRVNQLSYSQSKDSMVTADAGDPSTELEPPPLSPKSPLWKYFGFPVSYVDNVRVVDRKATVRKLCYGRVPYNSTGSTKFYCFCLFCCELECHLL